jgi:hypothetical protein
MCIVRLLRFPSMPRECTRVINEAAWRELFDDLLEAAAAAIHSHGTDPESMKQVRGARNVILRVRDLLSKGKEPPFRIMLQTVEAAYIIGKSCVVTPPVKKFIEQERAKDARDKRAQSPREIAIRDAIKAEYVAMFENGSPVDLGRPYAAAETLLEGVNTRLTAAGKMGGRRFKPIRSKSVGDRIQKLHSEGFFVLEE